MVINVGIVGVMGYAGEDLLRLLLKHTEVKLTYLSDKNDSLPKSINSIYPDLKLDNNILCENYDATAAVTKTALIFLALPHTVSLQIAPELVAKGKRVIDLSADFRLYSKKVYKKWYGVKHTAEDLLKDTVYGLPEIYRDKIKSAMLIANPGCYPTSTILGCTPFLKSGVVKTKNIVIDSKSGISGGGRQFVADYTAENRPSTKAYQIGGVHRHIPEIEQELSIAAGLEDKTLHVVFTPHITPQLRGIVSTIYLDLKTKIDTEKAIDILKKFYQSEPFVRIIDPPAVPETKNVVNTNFCDITARVDKRTKKLIVVSVIDNLGKGASSQAVQNFNIMLGLKETLGLM